MLNIVIPMAGLGSRYAESHHRAPKPLIEIRPGKRMIEYVIDYLTPAEPHRFIFVCQKEHVETFSLGRFLRSRTRRCRIVTTERVTAGPASSALLARPFMDNDDELLVAYCDDYLRLDIDRYLDATRRRGADGSVVIYPSRNPGCSYVELDEAGWVLRAAEKKVISPFATAGLYYFRHGRDFIRAARRMIRRGKRARNEFFVCPVYNELIAEGRTILSYPILPERNLGMGTPSELARFRRLYRAQRLRLSLAGEGRANELLLGTKNHDKGKELARLLDNGGLRVLTLADFPGSPDVRETGRTFEANARLKARAFGRRTGALTLADDSGLMVDALNGRPGVHSARFAGPGCTYADNNRKLLKLLAKKTGGARSARFVCVMALYDGARSVGIARGECRGRIAVSARGERGFGYDPVFIPAGSKKTFAEMSRAAKNALSHRGRALRAAKRLILNYLRKNR